MSDRDGERERSDEYAGPPPAAPRERDASASADTYAPPPQTSSSYAPPPPMPAYGDSAPPAPSRSDGGLPVQRMVNRRDGDWDCSRCGNLNFARRVECHKCHCPKAGTEGSSGAGGAPPPQSDRRPFDDRATREKRPGDWDCSCGVLNFSRRTVCMKCGVPNPGGAGGGGGPPPYRRERSRSRDRGGYAPPPSYSGYAPPPGYPAYGGYAPPPYPYYAPPPSSGYAPPPSSQQYHAPSAYAPPPAYGPPPDYPSGYGGGGYAGSGGAQSGPPPRHQ